MSEPIGSNRTLRIEMPNDPVGINLVRAHVAYDPTEVASKDKDEHPDGKQAALIRTDKVEIRFDGSSLPTKDTKGKPIDWEKTAYNAAHQAAFYRQVNDNANARADQAERALTTAEGNYRRTLQEKQNVEADLARLRPFINEAYKLRQWWGYFLLPKSFKLHV